MNKSYSHIFNKHRLNPYSWIWIPNDYTYYKHESCKPYKYMSYYKNLSIYYRFKILTTPQIQYEKLN